MRTKKGQGFNTWYHQQFIHFSFDFNPFTSNVINCRLLNFTTSFGTNLKKHCSGSSYEQLGGDICLGQFAIESRREQQAVSEHTYFQGTIDNLLVLCFFEISHP
jgi:hypothetical protein